MSSRNVRKSTSLPVLVYGGGQMVFDGTNATISTKEKPSPKIRQTRVRIHDRELIILRNESRVRSYIHNKLRKAGFPIVSMEETIVPKTGKTILSIAGEYGIIQTFQHPSGDCTEYTWKCTEDDWRAHNKGTRNDPVPKKKILKKRGLTQNRNWRQQSWKAGEPISIGGAISLDSYGQVIPAKLSGASIFGLAKNNAEPGEEVGIVFSAKPIVIDCTLTAPFEDFVLKGKEAKDFSEEVHKKIMESMSVPPRLLKK